MTLGLVKEDIDRWYDLGLCTKTRVIYLGGLSGDDHGDDEDYTGEAPIYWNTARRLIKALHVLDSNARAGNKPITIIMNSCGGEWSHGMAIYDAIKSARNYVTIINMSHARSMTSLIFQAADYRITAPHGYFMIHDGETSLSGPPGTVISNMRYEEEFMLPTMYRIYLGRLQEKDSEGEYKVDIQEAADILNAKMPKGAERIRPSRGIEGIREAHISQLCSRDTFFTPTEMIKLNFADRLLESNDLAGSYANPDMLELAAGQESLKDDDWTNCE